MYDNLTRTNLEFAYREAEKRIEQLEKENKSLGERCLQLQKDKGNLTDRVRELEAQIEKMKNCKNCNKLKKEKDGLLVCTVGSFYTNVFGKNCDKWELED